MDVFRCNATFEEAPDTNVIWPTLDPSFEDTVTLTNIIDFVT